MHDDTHGGCASTSSPWATRVILRAILRACQLSIRERSNDPCTHMQLQGCAFKTYSTRGTDDFTGASVWTAVDVA